MKWFPTWAQAAAGGVVSWFALVLLGVCTDTVFIYGIVTGKADVVDWFFAVATSALVLASSAILGFKLGVGADGDDA